jgi:carboxylesterase type B
VYDKILELWPANDLLLGAPFNTGDSLFDRAEAWYTDEMFLAPRRLFFENAASLQPMFAYYFKEFFPGDNVTLGVFHASELDLLFGPVPTPVEDEFANQMLDFYINFVNDLNPGSAWPRYSVASGSKNVLQLLRNNITAIPDDWDLDRTQFLLTQEVLDEFQK